MAWALAPAGNRAALAARDPQRPIAALDQPIPVGDDNYVLADTWPLPVGPHEPIDLALGPGGRLYVADGGRNAVLVYGPDGAYRGTWEIYDYTLLFPRDPNVVFVPLAVAADGERGHVYVVWQRFEQSAEGWAPKTMFLDSRPLDGGASEPLVALPYTLAAVTDMNVDAATGDLFMMAAGVVRRFRLATHVFDSTAAVADPGAGVRQFAASYDGRVAVARPAEASVVFYRWNGTLIDTLDLGGYVPVSLAADGVGNLYVLVQAPNADNPGATLLMVFDPSGTRIRTEAAGTMGAAVPGNRGWPWALAVASDGLALSTGSSRFQVHWFDSAGAIRGRLLGGRVRPAYTLQAAGPAPGNTVALTVDSAGRLAALDAREGRVVGFTDLGRMAILGSVPTDAIDLSVGPLGELYIATASNRLMQFAPGDPITPTWTANCECDLGGRLATSGDVLYVGRPRTHSVATFDTLEGLGLREIRLAGSVGLWPSDLAVGSDGRLYTADLVTAQVQAWRQPQAPDVTWQAGLLSGPRRLAAGLLGDGTAVVAAIMADGFVELHAPADGSLLSRWRPALQDGTMLAVTDIAVSGDGRVYLADEKAHAVRVFEPGIGVPPPPVSTPGATPTPSPRTCTIRGDKVAAPGEIVVGGTTAITLSLSADCPASSRLVGADVVLVMDRSSSMRGAPLETAKDAARSFVELLDVRYHRIGLASFATTATLDVPLTGSIPAVIDGVNALAADGDTNMAAGIDSAFVNLRGFGRTEALPVIVLLTDGNFSARTADPRQIAATARAWGAQIYTIGLGNSVDSALLVDIAGSPDRYFAAPTPSELFPIYSQILRLVLASLAGNLIVDDALTDYFSLVPDSAQPSALTSPDRLRWGRSILPSSGITLTYRVKALTPGCWPANREAYADYTDADGANRRFVFPVPTVCVAAPSPTPTVTPAPTLAATLTPVPTAIPRLLYLPVAYRNQCLPGVAHADVVLAVDTSDSMAGDKLRAAQDAATAFVGQLELPSDQAAVLGFNTVATMAAALTGNRTTLERAIRNLKTAHGTQIDQALLAAAKELRSPRHKTKNRTVIILLSDGAQTGPAEDVLAAAREATAESGAAIYAIGLGADADMALLRDVAGPGRTFAAPDGRQLAAIYRQIAVAIPCR